MKRRTPCLTLSAALILLSAALSTSCAWAPHDRVLLGWGEVEYDEKGEVRKIKSDPPIKIEPLRVPSHE